jgi:hypothetical protein
MIRKMLVVAAAVAMPAAMLAGVTGVGVASATALPPTNQTCSISGAVTFAKPGISANGTITNKTSESSASTITPTGGCGTKAIKEKIPTATSACWTVLPTAFPLNGTLATGAAASCSSPTKLATALKDKYYYNSSASFITGGLTSIVSALSAGINVTNNGTKGKITVTGATAVLPGGVCGASDAGFDILGTTNFVGAAGHAEVRVCLSGDSGTLTTGSFVPDLTGGNPAIFITAAAIGGSAEIIYST